MVRILSTILQYLVGAFLGVLSLGFLIDGGLSLVGFLILLICSILIIPYSRNKIELKLNKRIDRRVKYSLPFIAFILPWFFADFNAPQIETPGKTNTSPTELVKDSMTTAKVKKSQGELRNMRDSSNKIEVEKIKPASKNVAKNVTNKNHIQSKPKAKQAKSSKPKVATVRKPKKKRRSTSRSKSKRSRAGKVYIRGPRGGCYYINSNGNKTYVDRSLCN